jgi:squalene cyclase
MENTEFRRTVAHADGDGGVVYETRQDVSGIIEQNQREFNQYDERAKWSGDVYGNKVASIPLTVIDDLNNQGIMRGFHVLDEKRFRAWLNNPDNRFFRTRPGNI